MTPFAKTRSAQLSRSPDLDALTHRSIGDLASLFQLQSPISSLANELGSSLTVAPEVPAKSPRRYLLSDLSKAKDSPTLCSRSVSDVVRSKPPLMPSSKMLGLSRTFTTSCLPSSSKLQDDIFDTSLTNNNFVPFLSESSKIRERQGSKESRSEDIKRKLSLPSQALKPSLSHWNQRKGSSNASRGVRRSSTSLKSFPLSDQSPPVPAFSINSTSPVLENNMMELDSKFSASVVISPPFKKLMRTHSSHSHTGVIIPENVRKLPASSNSMPYVPLKNTDHLGGWNQISNGFSGQHSQSLACEDLLPSTLASGDPFKRISADTLAKLLSGDYKDTIDEFHIVDCRFPYEFEGGHIVEAQNINHSRVLEETFFTSPPLPGRRVAIVFHCEYSAQRAPQMARHLRSHDRNLNAMSYPNLHYPNIYILKGGYREFYQAQKAYCDPQGYVEMSDASFKEESKACISNQKRQFRKCFSEGFLRN